MAREISVNDSGFSSDDRSPGSLPSTRARTARRTIFAERLGHRVRDAGVLLFLARLGNAEDPRNLALHGVRDADRGRLGDDAAHDRRRLELGRADPLAGDVQRVVAAAVQVPVAVLVDRGP